VGIELRELMPADLPLAHALLVACDLDEAAAVAEEKLFGDAPGGAASAVFGALERGQLVGLSVGSGRWIRLLAVAPGARRRGIGTALLAAAESAIEGTVVRTMDQPGNYLAPGVDARHHETIGWLKRRGYQEVEENASLVIELVGNPLVSEARGSELRERARSRGYQIRRAHTGDRAALAETVQQAFGRAWAFEIDRALAADPPAVHLALEADRIAAFAAHDGNNRGLGWFGPAGTLEAHRGRGLGEALLIACLLDLAGEGRRECTVAWIGPRDFYQRAAGIAREERFIVMAKDLGPDIDFPDPLGGSVAGGAPSP
jgi:mycothiol synthase